MRMKYFAVVLALTLEYAPHERGGTPAGRPGGTPRKADGAAWPRHARHLLECSDARLLRRRRLRVPPGEQPPVSDGHRSAGDDSGADAGKYQPSGNLIHPRGRRAARALGRPQPHHGGSHGAKRHSDRDDRRSVRLLRGRDVLETSHGRRQRRVRTVLCRARRRTRPVVDAARAVGQRNGGARTYPALWRQSEGTLLRIRRAGRDASSLGTSSGQDAVRAGRHAEERRHLERGA